MFGLYVQFIRNISCVIKSLLPNDNILLQSFTTVFKEHSQYTSLKEIKLIEYIIGITQLLAVVLSVSQGYYDCIVGIRNYSKCRTILPIIDKISIMRLSGGCEYTLIHHSVTENINRAYNQSVSGFLNLVIGVAFLFLALNSFHIEVPSHPLPLVNALISMEIALIYFLFQMGYSFSKNLSKSYYKYAMIKRIESKEGSVNTYQTLLLFCHSLGQNKNLMEIFQSLLAHDTVCDLTYITHGLALGSVQLEEDLIRDITNINRLLNTNKTITSTNYKQNIANNNSLISSLHEQSLSDYIESCFDMLLLVLNSIAFYGYFMTILAFYFPQSYFTNPLHNGIISHLLLNMTHDNADWYGNFAGDLAWTIEPLLILLKPTLKSYFILYFTVKVSIDKSSECSEVAWTSCSGSRPIRLSEPCSSVQARWQQNVAFRIINDKRVV
eukprot:gene5790-7988_t